MAKRLGVALLGAALGALVGWAVAVFASLGFLAVTAGMVLGSLIALVWAEKRGKVQKADELHKPLSISLSDRQTKP